MCIHIHMVCVCVCVCVCLSCVRGERYIVDEERDTKNVKQYYNKYNLKIIAKVSRDGSAKKYTHKGSRGNNRQGAPHTLFSSNRVSMKNIGMHLVCYFPYYPCLCTFCITIPNFLYLLLLLFYTDYES